MIKQHTPHFEKKWGRTIQDGSFKDWDRKTNTFAFLVVKSWWKRIVGSYRHSMTLEVDNISVEGYPFIDDTNVVQWLDESISGCAYVAAFEHFYQKHPQSTALLVVNLAVRFTNPGDLVMFKLRFGSLTKKDSLQDYVVP